jgi:hypothetical protein
MIFMEYLKLTRVMCVVELIRTNRTSDNKISVKKKLYNKLKRTVRGKSMRKMRRKKKHVRSSKFSKVK